MSERFSTRAIHVGEAPDPTTGAVVPPVYQTATYVHTSPGENRGYDYSRLENPTRQVTEAKIASLEGAKYGLCFSSGMSAVDAVVRLLRPGEGILASSGIYGGTFRSFDKMYPDMGIDTSYVSMHDASEVEKAITSKTKLLWVETPTNPMLNIADMKGLSEVAQRHKLLFVVDNTFASPYLQNPLDFGVQVVMHSVTKYLSGHSDVIMGALALNDEDLYERLHAVYRYHGAVPGPMDCYLVSRGIKTLSLRMERHCENARMMAQFLSEHPGVARVYYPGLEDHPSHALARKQMRDFGGMFSFEVKKEAQVARFFERSRYFTLAVSLGGVETLACHPASMTHAVYPEEERKKLGISDRLIRVSIGVEDVQDLLSDVEQALR